MEQITDINQIKAAVLKKVAQYAYDGLIMEKYDDIPFELINGVKPLFRCCVYREREIIRQRVRLAMGKHPSTAKDRTVTQIVQVISSACEGCPIARFTVTSNCHNCIAHKCMSACKFGAITKTPAGAYIDSSKCKKCGQCLKACPYNAIVDIQRPCIRSCPVDAITMDEDDLAIIDSSKCLNCGQCVTACPFGAVSDISFITNVINQIRNENNHVYAMFAPSIGGQFGDVSIPVIKEAIRRLGFKDCYEVALGADIVAYREAEEVIERTKEGKKTTTSCCPAFVNLIEKHFPEVKECISTTISPMAATARFIKAIDPMAIIVFIGPCIAKKYEAIRHYLTEVHMVLTFEELQAMFEVKNINFSEIESDQPEDATIYGKGFAKSGGVADAALKAAEEKGNEVEIKVLKCNGIQECKKAIALLKNGRISEDFIEGMSCEGGCINGPANTHDIIKIRKFFEKHKNNGNTEIVKNSHDKKLDKIQMHIHKH